MLNLETFLQREYEKLPEDKRPSGFYGCMAWFVVMQKKYKSLYGYDDGK